LQGVISFHEDAMPICGFAKSSSFIPTARSIPLAGARSKPSVTMPERGFMFELFEEPDMAQIILAIHAQ
jgi:hypothetical protein